MSASLRPLPAARRRARGFTLVEMLVSLVITSVGLLGVAKLALGTVQSNDSAFMRTQATALMQQIIDDMRANQPEAALGKYTVAMGVSPVGSDIASYDLSTWQATLGQQLPGGAGAVTTAAVTNPLTGQAETVATVQVEWNDSVAQTSFGASASAGTPMTITVETLL
ncbi:MAG TPA: type IV pilus modification protein PilV [Steroidobacteraceae bacterium]|nr:type IV pilus modification protein PilV [Steroidobacteraceae bacterium]